MLGISTDITERKKSEDKLREINAYLENLINYANAPIIVWDPQFRITRFNHAFEFLTGRSEAEVIGQSLEILFPPALAAQSMTLIRKTETGERWETVEIEIMHRDKSARTVLWNSATLFASDGQTPIATIAQGQDITDRKRAELKLKDALIEAQRFRKALDHVPAYVYMKDTKSRYTYANRQVLELFGCSIDEITGFDDARFFAPDTVKQIRKMESGVFQGKHITGEMDTVDKKGGRHVYLEVKTPIFAEPDGKVEGLVGIATDITDRKLVEEEIKLKNEELLKVNAEKDKFFSIIAHDLRSPFNSFLILTKIMAEGSPHLTMDGVREIAAGMRDSAANIFRLLENLLQWAVMQQGLMPFNPQTVRLRPIVEESVAMVLDPAKNKEIKIAAHIPDGMEVCAESNMLQTVIRNLVSNAVKFTPKGGEITLSAKAADNKNVEIAVKDSGIGMNRAIADNLFRLDVRTNRKGTASEPGTGLGLLLCKEFVEKHGGRIWVESKEEKGSAFYFTIPCNAEVKKENVIEEVVPADKKEIKAKKLKILIADDDEKSEMMISLTVKKLSKEILTAKTGDEAVAVCRNNSDLDLILMDIAMPNMDGYDAARQIRKFNKGVIIIAQTAYGLAGEREKAIAAGCNDYITKPFRPATLTALVKKYF